MSEITIQKYSEYSIVVRGDTKEYKEEFKKLGGKWNRNLKDGAGWVFIKSKEEELRNLIQSDGYNENKQGSSENKQIQLIHEADVIKDVENRISTLFQPMSFTERISFIERILKLAKI